MDKEYPIPLYYKVYQNLRQKILDGVYKPGDRIPPESELVQIYNVSRLTVRRALEELRSEGFITRAKGRGTFITGKKEEEQMNVLKGFTDKAKEEGFAVKSIVLENKLVEVPPDLAEVFAIDQGTMVILLKRVRYMNEEPVAIESAYLNTSVDVRLLNILKRDMSKESLYDFLRADLKLPLLRAYEILEVTQVSGMDAKYLNVSAGLCALLRKRYTYTTANKCLEFVRSIYRGDKYRFKIELKTTGVFEK